MKARPAFMLVGAAALTLAMGACSSSGGGTGATTPAAAPTTAAAPTAVTLTVWGPQEDQVDSTSWLPKQEAAFEAAHPEYKITWKNAVVSEGDAGKTVQQDPSAAADVYMFANDQLGTLVQAHAIGQLPPDAVAQVKQQNSDVMVTSVTGSDGNIYGVPYTANTWFLYYNSSKFTADDVKNLDSMLSKGKVAFPIDNSWYLASFYVGNGGTLFGPKGTDETAGIAFTGTQASDVTKYLTGLVKNKNFVNDANGAGLAGLQNGTIDAYFSGSWDAANVKKALGANEGAAQPPSYTLNGSPVQMKAFAGSKAVAFNPNAKNPQAAAKFAAFLGSTAAQQAHYDMRGIIPSDKSLASSASITADPVAVAQMNTVANASTLQPTVAKMGNFWDPTASFGKALLSGDITAANAADKTAAWNTALNS
ncbi:MAG: ABC transporter substrate-binding protein [Cellulomonas sp. 73-92]|uniref:extracellular solute-binding protein n=1 Tax=Cellulomonas sp. 73-92 TaxID=1895740 RepID=UPI00092C3A1B|nr:extracellular solute-binding protein [Cellulomonas sp. 73-92]OJV76579.1 MAG: ABC transporter substrate-binding protein [Cellulomonas sp. 73-92]